MAKFKSMYPLSTVAKADGKILRFDADGILEVTTPEDIAFVRSCICSSLVEVVEVKPMTKP